MPSRQVGSTGRNILNFELELQDVEAALEPGPSLLISSRWTPATPQPQENAAQLTVRFPCLEVRYAPSRSASRRTSSAPATVADSPSGRLRAPRLIVSMDPDPGDESIELGIAHLAVEETENSPTWASNAFFKKTVKFRLPLDFPVLGVGAARPEIAHARPLDDATFTKFTTSVRWIINAIRLADGRGAK